MRVAFDATAMLADNSRKTGITQRAYDLITEIMDNNPQNEYYCLNLFNYVLEREWHSKNFNEIDIYTGVLIEILRMPKYKSVLKKIIKGFIKENKIDVFIITDPFNPDLTVYDKGWFESVYTVALMFGQAPMFDRDKYFTSRRIQRKYQESIELIKNVDRVLVTPRNYKGELLQLFSEWRGKIAEEVNFNDVKLNRKISLDGKTIRKVAIFTPLPPIQSGIADYIVPLLYEFSKSFSVDVFIDNNYKYKCSLPDNVNVYRHYEFYDRRNEYDKIIYEVGCSTYHIYMFDYIQEFPGIIDLHDSNLYPLLCEELNAHVKLGLGKRFCRFLQWIKEDMPEIEAFRLAGLKFTNHTSGNPSENIVNSFLVNYASKVIVHNNYSKKLLLSKDISRNVEVIPLFSSARMITREDTSKKMIVVFGHLGTAKRPIPIVRAFKKLIESGYDAELLFVGRAYNDVDKKIMYYESTPLLRGRIKVLGFVNETEFISCMEKADVVVNLRYPYHGESSAILARAFGMGKCVIVNDVGAFSELPDNTCIKIPRVEEMTSIEEVCCINKAMEKALDFKYSGKVAYNAYIYASEKLNIHVTARKYIKLIESDNETFVSTEEIRQFIKNDKSFGGWI